MKFCITLFSVRAYRVHVGTEVTKFIGVALSMSDDISEPR